MIQTSEAYITAIKNPYRTDRLTGTITLADGTVITVTDEIIIANSVKIKEQIVHGEEMEIGTFYPRELDITVIDDNTAHSYANARITLFYGVLLADRTWEDVPLGIFKVDNSYTVRKRNRHILSAFDAAVDFDVDIAGYVYEGNRTVARHIIAMADELGIELESSVFSAFPNCNLIVTPSASSSIQTYRDMIEECCALMGVSAKINRYGKLELIQLKEKVTDGEYAFDYIVSGNERTGTEYFDLRALIKYVSTTFDGEPYTYTRNSVLNDEMGRNATLYLPENRLIKDMIQDVRRNIISNSLNGFSAVLRRVEFDFNGNPAIECFDTLGASGGKIDVDRIIAFFPTSLVWRYRGKHSVSCAYASLTEENSAGVGTFANNSLTPVKVKTKMQKQIDDTDKSANAPTVGKFTNSDRNAEIFNDYSGNVASGIYSHAEGFQTQATFSYAHAEGWSTAAFGSASHAEGQETVASGEKGHAEGYKTTASGTCSHAEGTLTNAARHSAHAEGFSTEANGQFSHAGGYYTIINTDSGTVVGRYNKTKEGLFVVGNGSGAARSDAMVLDDKGNLWIAGSFDMAGGYAPLTEHLADTDNPHSVTKAQIGLGNADNTSDIDKPVSKATQQALSLKADLTELANKSDKSELIAHTDNADNPHNLTVSQIGLCYPNLMPGSWQYDNLVADSTFTGINTEQFSVTPGQSLTVSCEASTTVSVTDKAIFLLQYYAEKNGTRISWEAFIGTITETGVFVPLQQTVTVPDGINYMSLGLRYYNCPKTFRKFKVENGELKTAWTVAVQDIIDNEARISALETALIALGGDIGV